MKRFITVLLALALMMLPVAALADGTVTCTDERIFDADGAWAMYKVTCACTGDASDGSIPDTTINGSTSGLKFGGPVGWALLKVQVDPGSTAPDAADVAINDAGGQDLLSGNGTNLIHATATQATYPMTDSVGMVQPITGTITLSVSNQATVNATYNVILYFVRP